MSKRPFPVFGVEHAAETAHVAVEDVRQPGAGADLLVTLPAAADVTVAAYRVRDEAAGLLTLVVRQAWWWSLARRGRRSATG